MAANILTATRVSRNHPTTVRLFNISVCDFLRLGRLRTAGPGVSAIARLQGMVWPAFMIFCCLGLPSAKGNPSQNAAASAAKETTAPTGMVWIPAGEFIMGTDDVRSFPNERPAHKVRVEGFWIDEHDVTNAEFAKFVEATAYLTTAERKPDWEELKKELPPGTPKPDDSVLVAGSLVFTPTSQPVPLNDLSAWWRWVPGASWRHPEGPGSGIGGRENHPVVQVSWDDAVAYAKWAGKRLPTEAEWEFAARGGLEGKRYSWGDEFRPGGKHMANTWQGLFPVTNTGEDGFVGTSPVKSFPPNGYGLYDMAGNVWQWCSDWYRVDAFTELSSQNVCRDTGGPSESWDPADPNAPKRVVKGGSFLCNPSYCESYRPSARRGTPPDTGSSHTGFRCVRSDPVGETAAPRAVSK